MPPAALEVSASSTVLLPHAPASVGTARWQLSTEMGAAGIADLAIGDAALVISELLSNSILHARPLPGGRVQVAWVLADGVIEVAVSDGGGVTRPRPAQPSLSALGGRGLAIVEYLSSRWGVYTTDMGTTVWAVMPAPSKDRATDAPGSGATANANGRYQNATANAVREA